jgi:hypothetical protein
VTSPPAAPTEQEAVDAFLADGISAEGRVSTLYAALDDGATVFAHSHALWLGTLAYLVSLELIGSTLARPGTSFRDRGGSERAFAAGALEFSPDPSDVALASVLYSLRCSFAHEYGLKNRDTHVFLLRRTGLLVEYASDTWGGVEASKITLDMTDLVNVRAVASYVEDLVARVRSENNNGGVILFKGVTPQSVMDFRTFFVSDPSAGSSP